MIRRFHQLDVFSQVPLRGNPLAVVHDAQGMDPSIMADFARWTNLSETTFLLPPDHPEADYKVRIFTPGRELPFAGHPTLGSCHAWLAAGGRPRRADMIIQECGVGLIRIRRDGDRLAFAAPPLVKSGPLDEALLQRIATGLGLSRATILRHQWVDNGPGWCAVMVEDVTCVIGLNPDFNLLKDMKIGVIAPQMSGSDTDFEVRAFVPGLGIPEDPVTGSLNAGLAPWLMREGLAGEHYVVSQGTALGRQGRVFIDKVGDDVWVGGDVAICIEGSVAL